jgi:hypothetical protein
MTKLTPNNIVVRETAVSDRGRPIVIELHPAHLVLRLKAFEIEHIGGLTASPRSALPIMTH